MYRYYTYQLVFFVFRIRIHWIRIRIQVFCWIRIWFQAVAGSESNPDPAQDFFMTKLLTLLQFENFQIINVFLVPTKDVQARQAWYFFIFPFLGENFSLPGPESGFPTRIRWLNWIRIQSGSGTLRICHLLWVRHFFWHMHPTDYPVR